MASYPGAVKTFTTRSAGQTIEASHINDLQDEVNAIEAGIRNGTAPLNSSNSTVAVLVVTGTSTLTGNVSVLGNFNAAGASTMNTLVVSGAFAVSGNSSLAANLNVSGASTFGGDMIVVSTVAVSGSLNLSSVLGMTEVSTAAAPAAGGARLYCRDNGAGKTQLMVVFSSGAPQQIAIEP